jgi:DNA-binding beta-propeller fold protein YncE
LINQNANRVDIYDYARQSVVQSIAVGNSPVAAAISMDYQYLYVSNNSSSTMTVIDLSIGAAGQSISLSAKPEGLEVGFDGRVLITTEGTSSDDRVNSLLLFDPSSRGQQVQPIAFAPPPPTPSPLTKATLPRPTTVFRGKLIRTPDGSFIIGLSTVNNNESTVLFVYEVASASILQSRTVTGQSTVLSISPEGSRFMAGFTLYETATLAVIGQQSTANLPFPISSDSSATFNTLQNVGGSAFASDGSTLYSAFNVAPSTRPAPRPQASTLLISDSHNLRTSLGIKLPESVIAKMVIKTDISEAWGLSESGLIHLPLAHLFDYPILQPETTTIFLAVDECNRGLATGRLKVSNAGKGKLTFSVPPATPALVATTASGVAPSEIVFALEPGRNGITRRYGTNLYSGAGSSNSGSAVSLDLVSPEAINIPNTIQVYMNLRQSDQRGIIYPVVTTPIGAEGLEDILLDSARSRVYITNSGYNRIEVFDIASQKFVTPIDVGQLPHQMAFAGDGKTLYVANTGGESISVVDLARGKVVDNLQFPPIPRSGTSEPITPQAIVKSPFGLQIVMSDGSQWKTVGTQVTTRPANAVTPVEFTVSDKNGPVRMIGGSDGKSIVTMEPSGKVYLYDGLNDTYALSNQPYSQSTIEGYFGPLAVGPNGDYFLENGWILNYSLTAVGGSATPTSASAGVAASRRNVAAVAPLDDTSFIRLTTPVLQNVGGTSASDGRTVLELVKLDTGAVTVVGAVAENPIRSLFGNTRINVFPRQMALDSAGNVYALTLSGLSVIPLRSSGRPQLTSGANAVINATDGSRNFRPGSFLLISGSNLATPSTAQDLTAPRVLGGSCVTFSDVAIPILQTSGGQIFAQIPSDLTAGVYVMKVRSLSTGQQSDPIAVNVQSQ